MKMHILAETKPGPWGGTSQFLKALKKQLKQDGAYTDDPQASDVILFNSYPSGAEYLFQTLYDIKLASPEKIVLYRIDGPISGYRGTDSEIDQVIALYSHLLVDGIVFQSRWSCAQNQAKFNIRAPYETVILNAPDKTLFYNIGKRATLMPGEKIRLISSGWSTNPLKGFAMLRWLDEHLDFSKYSFTFIGNTPIQFKHIITEPAVPSTKLAERLKEQDIYVFTSTIEACSNALSEALACGLPALAPNTSSNPEVVQGGGELYTGEGDIVEKLDRIAQHYPDYIARLPSFDIATVAQAYHRFAQEIYAEQKAGRYQPKRVESKESQLIFRSLKRLIWRIKIKGILRTLHKLFLCPFYGH